MEKLIKKLFTTVLLIFNPDITDLLSSLFNDTVGLLLNLPLYKPIENADTSDSLVHYFLVFILLIAAFLTTVLLSKKDKSRNRKNFELKWSILIVRIFFAVNMFYYGLYKVIPVQFSELGLFQLLKPLGEYSPGSFLWAFMGFSQSYQIIAGLMELSAGFFILFPRLTNLGALIGVVVMSNVFMLNLFYDVSVKLGSFHVLLSAFFLLCTQFKTWTSALFKNQIVMSIQYESLFKAKKMNHLVTVYIALFFISFSFKIITRGLDRFNKEKNIISTTPFFGLWSVDEYQQTAFNVNWKRFIYPRPGKFYIQTIDNKFIRLNLKNESDNKFSIEEMTANEFKSSISIKQENGVLRISGIIGSDAIDLNLKQEIIQPTILMSRKLDLITEGWYGR